MRISSASVGMESARSFRTASYSFRRLEEMDLSGAFSRRTFKDGGTASEKGELKEDSKENKGAKNGKMITKEEIIDLQKRMEGVNRNQVVRSADKTEAETIRQSSIMYILELLFGDAKSRFRDWIENSSKGYSFTGSENTAAASSNVVTAGKEGLTGADLLTMDASEIMQRPAQVFHLSHVERYEEYEETSFSASAKVRCADGREFDFNIDVSMSRSFVQQTSLDLGVEMVKTCDPLVINLDGNVASVSDQKIRFDIDGDGEMDTVNALQKGSGYLALDRNGDGEINDGTELFGAKSGDGFADLSQYDRDGNGWIDEDDEIWNKLKIWVMDERGHSQLYSLSEAGVGALCLNKMSTDFADKDENNASKAFIRSTGIFMYENGLAGTLQHLDLVKYAEG